MTGRLISAFAAALVLAALSTRSTAAVVQAVVVVGERGCKKYDRVVLYSNRGFVIADQYSGSFDKDDTVYGELNSYGSKDVLVNGRAGRLYVDDYGLSKNQAAEKCFRD